jgi:hypothetical protein
MRRIGFGVVICALACAAIPVAAQSPTSTPSSPAAGPVIQIEDVDRFYKLYDAAGGHPTADQLQHDYIDPGSDGLHHFATVRNISGTTIAKTLAEHPEIYSDAKRCMDVLPRVRQRLQAALLELGRLYPEARFPPVTIVVGRGKPVAIGGPTPASRSALRPFAPRTGSTPTSRNALCTSSLMNMFTSSSRRFSPKTSIPPCLSCPSSKVWANSSAT